MSDATSSSTPRPKSRRDVPKVSADKVLCSEVCQARCCSWGFPTLSPEEAQWLPKLAEALGLPQPEIVPVPGSDGEAKEYVLHATPCVFLGESKLCLIYPNRPEHCRAFPDMVLEWCPLSRRLHHEARTSA